MIPKVIHYCWFGGNPLPWDVKKCIASWKKFCPDYEIRQWNEQNFDVSSHPFVKAAYEAGAWAFVSDYARLQIVYDYGGIYMDTDVELLRSPDFLLQEESWFGIQQSDRRVNTGLGFGAQKGSAAVCAMLRAYDGLSFDPAHKVELACPVQNTEALVPLGYVYSEQVQHLPGATVYPPCWFDPLAPGDTQNLLCADSVSVHHYSSSWQSGKSRFKRQLIRLIGQERVVRFRNWLREKRG